MDDLVRRREVDILNDLCRLSPLGTLTCPASIVRWPSPELDAPDSWRWLPPRGFPTEWEWLEILSGLNAIRLTCRHVAKFLTVRVYVVPEDVRKLGIMYNKKGREAFHRLLHEVDTRPTSWMYATPSQEPQKVLQDESRTTLAQIYNTLESPTVNLPSFPITPHERIALGAIKSNSIPALSAQLYPYQARTVQRMFLKETYPTQMLDPRFIHVKGPLDNDLYLCMDEYNFWKYPTIYETSNGGILGEEMGSGKTCESLALILVTLDQMPANPAHLPGSDLIDPQIKENAVSRSLRSLQDLAAAAVRREYVPYRWREYDLSENCLALLDRYRSSYIIPPPPLRIRLRRHLVDEDGNEIAKPQDTRPGTQQWLSHATLVVVPDTLVSQWRHEITKHVQADVLRVLVITSSSKRLQESIPPINELLRFDIVLISHSRFSREEEQISITQECRCSYKGRTREIECTCSAVLGYVSPLTSIHWKRLIVDEGHTMSSNHTKAVRFAASLNVERKWVVSGTPSRGLVGASADGQEGTQNEKFDLDRLSVTIIDFLGFRAVDKWKWKKYISKPFLDRSMGAVQVVRSLLNSIIVRNRQSDIQKDVVLPPLSKSVVYLDATRETVLSQNIFNALIAINAVTSQRKDQDYFFHKTQANALQAVVRNMLVSTFHWTGTSFKDVQSAFLVAQQALKVYRDVYTKADCRLLQESCVVLQNAMKSDLWQHMSERHEMGYYLRGSFPDEALQYYALSQKENNILGGTAVIEAQRAVRDALTTSKTDDVTYDQHLVHNLTSSGIKNRARDARQKANFVSRSPVKSEKSPMATNTGSPTKSSDNRINLVSQAKTKLTIQRNKQITDAVDQAHLAGQDLVSTSTPPTLVTKSPIKKVNGDTMNHRDSTLSKWSLAEQSQMLAEAESLSSISITSTSSAKLNYLLTEIQRHHPKEKIIVFSDFVDHTFHLAEALDIIDVPYLLYTSSLKPAMKNRYILTFNTSETFRVMIMDLQLAAHGLNLSTASRVYFIQQCWSGAIESQAIKRAHRIGQTKPVHVEILVLRGSLEESMQRRRVVLTGRELGDTKSVTDDQVLRTAISHPTFLKDPDEQGPATTRAPSFPLFFVGHESGEGETGLVPLDEQESVSIKAPSNVPSPSSTPKPKFRGDESGISNVVVKRSRFDLDGERKAKKVKIV